MSVVEVNSLEEYSTYLSKSKCVYAIIDFYASWCRPCKKISPYFQELSEKYGDIDFLKVDVDQIPQLADDYNVGTLPTFIIVSTKNVEVEERLESSNESHLKKLCEKYN